jgi:hypothetical protein
VYEAVGAVDSRRGSQRVSLALRVTNNEGRRRGWVKMHAVRAVVLAFLVVVALIIAFGSQFGWSFTPFLGSAGAPGSVGRFQLVGSGESLVVRVDTKTGEMRAFLVVPKRDGEGEFRQIARYFNTFDAY